MVEANPRIKSLISSGLLWQQLRVETCTLCPGMGLLRLVHVVALLDPPLAFGGGVLRLVAVKGPPLVTRSLAHQRTYSLEFERYDRHASPTHEMIWQLPVVRVALGELLLDVSGHGLYRPVALLFAGHFPRHVRRQARPSRKPSGWRSVDINAAMAPKVQTRKPRTTLHTWRSYYREEDARNE